MDVPLFLTIQFAREIGRKSKMSNTKFLDDPGMVNGFVSVHRIASADLLAGKQ